jgi:outer membrane protein OmpA-like peptidoglycan-associated protein
MKRTILFFLFLLSFVGASYSAAFHFVNEIGKKYRFKNLIHQDIYRNGSFFKSVESMNKATLEVTDITNGFGLFQGKYYYYEKNANINESFKLKDIYESFFYKNEQGEMFVSPQVLMPSLRSIPTFPTNDLKPGDSWRAKGEEIHEGILEKGNILLFDVDVYYKYLGEESFNNKSYSKISIDYHIIHYPKNDPDILSFTGFSHSFYYWDPAYFSPSFYNEDYSFLFTLRSGETALYTGSTEGKVDYVSDVTEPKKKEIIQEISNKIPVSSGISVKNVVDGIIVNLGNILFDFNKASLKSEFEKRLGQIAEILRKYPELDIIISGHTDNIGAESYNQNLSENRAKTVSDYLIKKGIAPNRLSYIGYGSQKPLLDNSTETGRAQNRRVEIKIITKE